MEGVVRTRVGYTGGTKSSPTYHDLGDHSESIEVVFDPAILSYDDLLDVFWKSHDPTSGSWCAQYKCAIFTRDAEQERAALASRDVVRARVGRTVTTEIVPAGVFTEAEAYHQKYELRQSRELMDELRRFYPDDRDLVASTAAARLNGWLGGRGRATLERDLPRLGLSTDGATALREMVGRFTH